MAKRAASICALFSALAGCQQGVAAGAGRADNLEPAVMRSIEARSAAGTGFTIEGAPRGPWMATLSGPDGVRRVSPDHCPALQTAVDGFDDLPPVDGGWPRPSPGSSTIPIPPTRVHGESWRVSSAGFFPDVSQVNLTVEGSQGPYAAWAAQTFAALAACPGGEEG